MIIAVDGTSASGKGTIARALADHFGLPHLDTGLLYRAVGREVQLSGGDPDDDAQALAACDFPPERLADPALRSEEVGGFASRVSVHPRVRDALKTRQVDFANQPGGAVLDGRDIGTVIAPDADVKLFITASVDARTARRLNEMQAKGEDVDEVAIREQIERRDARDTGRATAPLVPAPNAHILDTSMLDKEQAIAAAIGICEDALGEGKA